MAEVHMSIADANIEFLQMERRYNYTTPTSYLELISFYKTLVDKKRDSKFIFSLINIIYRNH